MGIAFMDPEANIIMRPVFKTKKQSYECKIVSKSNFFRIRKESKTNYTL